jgi:hypothetical protein
MEQNMTLPEALDKYIDFRIAPEHRSCDDSKFCSEHSIGLGTLRKLKAEHPEWAKEALRRSRDQRVVELLYVDDGVFTQAKHGNVKAAELMYERIEGYVRPKTPVQVGVMVNLAGALRDAYQNRTAIDVERPAQLTEVVEGDSDSVRK